MAMAAATFAAQKDLAGMTNASGYGVHKLVLVHSLSLASLELELAAMAAVTNPSLILFAFILFDCDVYLVAHYNVERIIVRYMYSSVHVSNSAIHINKNPLAKEKL